MIDWLTLIVPYQGPDICGGRVLTLTPDGEVKFESLLFAEVEGSFSFKSVVKTVPDGLYISGNPSKYLQGHNVDGSDDVLGLAYAWGSDILGKIGVYDLGVLSCLRTGQFRLTRIDLTFSFQLNNIADVRAWLRSAGLFATGKNSKIKAEGGTIYFNKNSRYRSIKMYGKGDELKAHPFKVGCDIIKEKLIDYASRLLRVEIVLRSLRLKYVGLEFGYQWKCFSKNSFCRGKVMEFYANELKSVKLPLDSENILPDAVDVNCLEPRYRAVYQVWSDGHDVAKYYHRRTYYRHRAYFLKAYKIDIGIPCKRPESTVIPLLRVLEARPAVAPSWMHDAGLIFQPRLVA